MKRVDDFRFTLGGKELVPIIVGGMGVDISTAELALVAARLGGIGHISDAMVPAVSDRRFETHFVREKLKKYMNIKLEEYKYEKPKEMVVETSNNNLEYAKCPNCQIVANTGEEVEKLFGFRTHNGKQIVQSWCVECRSA